MDRYVSKQEAEREMASASFRSSEYPPLGAPPRPERGQMPEEPRRYNRARQRRMIRVFNPVEAPTTEPVETPVVDRDSKGKKNEFNNETKKLNIKIVGLYKNLKLIKSIKENPSIYSSKQIIYQFKRAIDNMIPAFLSERIFESIKSGSENIYFSDSFFNLYQSFNEVKNRGYVGLVQLNNDTKIYNRISNNGQLNKREINNLEQILKLDMITHIINLYQLFRKKYSEDSVEGLILRMQQSIYVIIKRNKLQDEKDMIYFFINQILIGHNSNELKVNLARSDQQKQNIEKVIAASEQQRAERIRNDTRYQQIRQREEQSRRQSDERQVDFIYKGIMEDLERNVKTQIREGKEGQRGSLTRQLRNMVEQRFETTDGEVIIKVPEEFIDPFSYQMMRNPVIVSDGRTYDITSIQNLIYPFNGYEGIPLETTNVQQRYNNNTSINTLSITLGPGRPKFIRNQALRQRINNYLEEVYPGLLTRDHQVVAEHDFNF
jgi:hypothetical protein